MAQSDNQFKTVIKGWIQNGIGQIHTALPGVVISYDAGSNKAKVQPVGSYKVSDGRSITFPVIHDVPVVFPMGMGGSAGMTFPVVAGDGCLIIFSESQMDDFLNAGYDSDDMRTHDIRDAICVPGLYAPQVSASGASQADVCIFNGSTMLKVSNGSVSITGATLSVSGGISGGAGLTVSGDVVGGGISLDNHIHNGDSGGTTSAPL